MNLHLYSKRTMLCRSHQAAHSPLTIAILRRPFTTSRSQSARAPRIPTIPNSSIKIFNSIPDMRAWRRQQILDHRSVGLVPTMGALHSGHTSLIKLAASHTSSVVVSVYLNPAQFGVHEDLDKYPQTWDEDCAMLRDLDRELADDGGMGKIAAVFAPATATMYPSGFPGQAVDAKGSFVSITPLADILEGGTRPTFFRGVATVCMKLFNIVTPEKVFFGQKDVQQTVIIRKMVKDFCMDTEVVIGSTIREPDGLALSSRNVYLGKRRRAIATLLSRCLRSAEAQYEQGCRTRDEILGPANELAKQLLAEQVQLGPERRALFEMDYMSLADPDDLEEVDVVDETRGAVLSGAVKMLSVESPQKGEDLGLSDGPPVRLIDNIILKAKR